MQFRIFRIRNEVGFFARMVLRINFAECQTTLIADIGIPAVRQCEISCRMLAFVLAVDAESCGFFRKLMRFFSDERITADTIVPLVPLASGAAEVTSAISGSMISTVISQR